ncbi:MAG: methyltransferase domain-containing protein [Caulobacteraceae bacterium]
MRRPDFAQRSDWTELMDADDTDYDTFRACLVDLAKVNVVTLAHRPTLAFLDTLHRTGRLPADRPTTILDVGSGYGDLLRAIDRWAERKGVSVALTGVDLNPWSAKSARAATGAGRPVQWATSDIFDHHDGADIVVSSLFTHHLTDAQAARFLSWSEASARIGWFVNDLHRHPFPYYGFALLARVARWHRFVRHDGPVSIARAFQAHDWRRLLASAGLAPDAAKVIWRFPFRLCVARIKA